MSNLKKNLIDWLPKEQRKFAKGNCYDFLVQQLEIFLEDVNSFEAKESLKLAKSNFDHYCESQPEIEKVKKDIENEIEENQKNEKLKRLYEKQNKI